MLVIVPSAQITGTSLPDRFAAWLFGITGQSDDPDPQWRLLFEEAGFSLQLDRVKLPRAAVLRLTARKLTTRPWFASPELKP